MSAAAEADKRRLSPEGRAAVECELKRGDNVFAWRGYLVGNNGHVLGHLAETGDPVVDFGGHGRAFTGIRVCDRGDLWRRQ